MKIEKKFFLTILSFTTFINITTVTFFHSYLSKQLHDSFNERYSFISNILSNTMQQLERNVDNLMYNSAYLIEEIIKKEGMPNNSKLKDISKKLGVSHLYITDANGVFIRSTRENPMILPNIFSFCSKYKEWFQLGKTINPTGVLPGIPAGVSSKFYLHGTKDKKNIIEINVEASFIAETVEKALQSDSNIKSIELLSPNKTSLGLFTKGKEVFYQKNPRPNTDKLDKKSNKEILYLKKYVQANYKFCCSCIRRELTLENNEYYYILSLKISKRSLNDSLNNITFITISISLVVLILSLIISKAISKKIVRRVDELIDKINDIILNGGLKDRLQLKGGDEIKQIGDNFDKMLEFIEENQNKIIELEKDKIISQITRQVAHDIRSPLAALNLILKLIPINVEEKNRLLIRNAIKRIDDIANNLLNKYKTLQSNDIIHFHELSIAHISSTIDKIILEKNINYSEKNISINLIIENNSYDLFSKINQADFSRMISNIINNSVESIHGSGKIDIFLKRKDNLILIEISDNGTGIKNESISKILTGANISIGKEKGSGMGISHAIKYLKSSCGSFDLKSEYGKGTSVYISIPLFPPPSWFISELTISKDHTIVVIDDDPSIHQIWDERFSELQQNHAHMIHFNTPQKLKNYVSTTGNHTNKNSITFLCDYEFLGHKENGLDLIIKLKIESNSILVTSLYDDNEVVKKSEEFNIKILPKSMASYIKIKKIE
jgi:signal transduction histidine kinase